MFRQLPIIAIINYFYLVFCYTCGIRPKCFKVKSVKTEYPVHICLLQSPIKAFFPMNLTYFACNLGGMEISLWHCNILLLDSTPKMCRMLLFVYNDISFSLSLYKVGSKIISKVNAFMPNRISVSKKPVSLSSNTLNSILPLLMASVSFGSISDKNIGNK